VIELYERDRPLLRREVLEAFLAQGGNVPNTAVMLGIKRSSLRHLQRKLGIAREVDVIRERARQKFSLAPAQRGIPAGNP